MVKEKYFQKDTCIIDDSLHISLGPVEPETPFIKRTMPKWVGKAFQRMILKDSGYILRRFMPRRQQEPPK